MTTFAVLSVCPPLFLSFSLKVQSGLSEAFPLNHPAVSFFYLFNTMSTISFIRTLKESWEKIKMLAYGNGIKLTKKFREGTWSQAKKM